MSNHFYIPANEQSHFPSIGELLKCGKCERKILVQMGINGTPHHFGTSVTCADCLVIDDDFCKKYPDIAKKIQDWKAT
jgi:hypothetical protein